jgi:hypothetical protein
MEPAILFEHLVRFVLGLVVAAEVAGASNEDLPLTQ